jgi:PKD repeat protein
MRSSFLCRSRRRKQPSSSPRASLVVELLEDRTVPTITTGTNFEGLDFVATQDGAPPDPIAAVGPNFIVEMVNSDIAVYQKDGTLVFQQDLTQFFAPVRTPGSRPFSIKFITDPVVGYDEQANVFFVAALDVDTFLGRTINSDQLLYAVLDGSNPTVATEMHNINVTETIGGNTIIGDYPRLGWNADAHIITLNSYTTSDSYNHASVITINKASVLDGNSSTFSFTNSNLGSSHFTLAPATMHDSQPGDPMWFVEVPTAAINSTGSSNTIQVVKETNVLSAAPTFDTFSLGVDAYRNPPLATQKGASTLIQTNDARILNAEWRDSKLVATHTVGVTGDSQSHARWYQIDIDPTTMTPSLGQQGTLGVGTGSNSYFPGIAIAPNGDLGLSYIQSSSSEYMSVYVTGRTASDAPGTMQTPVLAKAGEAPLSQFDGSPYRAGDYSGITVDPVNGTFWIVNEYAEVKTDPNANWTTRIVNFWLTTPVPNQPPSAVVNGPYSGTEDAAVQFDATGSEDKDGDSLTYTWNFGDGTTITTTSSTISHTYLWGGNFTVILTVRDGKGGTDTAMTTADITEVNDPPEPNAGGPYSGRTGRSITFDASATTDFDNTDGSPTNNQTLTYTWDFGDGSTGTGSTVTHAYEATGTYEVTLTVSDGVTSSTATAMATITNKGGGGGGGGGGHGKGSGKTHQSVVAETVTALLDVYSPAPPAILHRLEQAMRNGTSNDASEEESTFVFRAEQTIESAVDAFFAALPQDKGKATS